MGLFTRKTNNNQFHLPVWFMRQAGRYHHHYQNIKRNSDFYTMCKDSKLAYEITMGPIEDFKFDAAILFSDLLFPLEQLSMGLNYYEGPPKLAWHLKTIDDLKKIKVLENSDKFYHFQKEALTLLKNNLPKDKTLIGFVGAPFTLYTYAVEGSHAGNLVSSKQGLYDGRFHGFIEKLLPILIENIQIQLSGGAEVIALFDTAAGELCLADYKEFIVPLLNQIAAKIKSDFPKSKFLYYSKLTQLSYLQALDLKDIDIIAVDWRNDLLEIQKGLPPHLYIQGNIDPGWLHLPKAILEKKLNNYIEQYQKNGLDFSRWIPGLGHGVLIETPEENVRRAVEIIQNTVY